MKLFSIIYILIGFGLVSLHAQTDHSDSLARIKKSIDTNEVFTFVEVMPKFPGDKNALNVFLGKNIHYPTKAVEQGIQGKVLATFVVEMNGQVTGIRIKKGIGAGCDEEVLRVLKLMPAWEPGNKDGHVVRVQFVLPVDFKLK